jgi:hypothetical protein
MLHRACPLLTIVLAAGLVLTRRRLNEAEAELERIRAGGSAPTASVAQSAPAQPAATGDEGAATSGGKDGEATTAASDLSAEWEQAVPPMDS